MIPRENASLPLPDLEPVIGDGSRSHLLSTGPRHVKTWGPLKSPPPGVRASVHKDIVQHCSRGAVRLECQTQRRPTRPRRSEYHSDRGDRQPDVDVSSSMRLKSLDGAAIPEMDFQGTGLHTVQGRGAINLPPLCGIGKQREGILCDPDFPLFPSPD